MKLTWKVYGVLTVVFLASIAFTWIARASGVWQDLYAAPGVIALLGVLWQLFRDEAAHTRAVALERDKQQFNLGITSHMADVAFDRHVALCDEFAQELFSTLQCVMSNSQDHEAIKHKADSIGNIVRKHAIWTTQELQDKLQKFESVIREIGAKSYAAANHPGSVQWDQPLSLLLDLIDTGSPYGAPPKKEVLHQQIIDNARRILGVKELTDLRKKLLERSL